MPTSIVPARSLSRCFCRRVALRAWRPLPAALFPQKGKRKKHATTMAKLDHIRDAVCRDCCGFGLCVAPSFRLHAAARAIAAIICGPLTCDPADRHVRVQVESRLLALHRDRRPQGPGEGGTCRLGGLL